MDSMGNMEEFENEILMKELTGEGNDWYYISSEIKLTEEFMDKYADKLEWSWICRYQTLSENFIERHIDKVNWLYIYINQNLSANFIKKYKDKIRYSLPSKVRR